MNDRPLIALLTDFGGRDGYEAAMKGVILSLVPDARLVDIAHDIEPFRVESASYILKTVYYLFPPGTTFIAVVDPGVGTDRRALIVEAARQTFIGPDNGIFSWILVREEARIFSLDISQLSCKREPMSATFHGRAVFAPLAAFVAQGVTVERGLSLCTTPYVAPWVRPIWDGTTLRGHVVHIDRFGNLITNIQRAHLEGCGATPHNVILPSCGMVLPLLDTYGSTTRGSTLALWGSNDHLEISVNQGSAAKVLRLSFGDEVVLRAL